MSVIQSISTSVSLATARENALRAEPISIQWNPNLPIFAKEEFLRAVGDDYGWLGGIDETGSLRCILPYTIVRKMGLRMVRFRTETIPNGAGLDVGEEKSFLNSVVGYFRNSGADVIIPATNNSIFQTYPDGAEAAPYGTYVIDLQQPEDVLWKNIGRKTRQNIGTAQKSGITVREATEQTAAAYDLIRDTFRRSSLSFMERANFERFVQGLGENRKLLASEWEGVVQSYCLFAFSNLGAYAIYAGNLEHQRQGANKLLYWEAIRLFRSAGVRRFDFYGARINPPKGSKQDGINLLKTLMGARLSQGYIWKYALRPWRTWVYSAGVRMLRGGDIVDQERRRLLVQPCPDKAMSGTPDQ